MSNDLDEVFNKMFDNLIPGVWQKLIGEDSLWIKEHIKQNKKSANFF